MNVSASSNIGLVRKTNEDNYLVKEELGLFIVADGMGGHKGGQLASSLAIQTIDEFLVEEQDLKNKSMGLCLALKAANSRIYKEAHKSNNVGMGTTVTAARIHENMAYIAHIGDSRVYLIRNNEIKRMTNDHSLVGELLRSGELSEEEALRHPHRNILTRALGTEPEVEVDLIEVELVPQDLLLLCTDGLTNHVEENKIFRIIADNHSKDAVNQLIKASLDSGGADNITVILVNPEG